MLYSFEQADLVNIQTRVNLFISTALSMSIVKVKTASGTVTPDTRPFFLFSTVFYIDLILANKDRALDLAVISLNVDQ